MSQRDGLSVAKILDSPKLTDGILAHMAEPHFGVCYDGEYGDMYHFFVLDNANGGVYYSHNEPRNGRHLCGLAQEWRAEIWKRLYGMREPQVPGGWDEPA